jgi:hypothetical protein
MTGQLQARQLAFEADLAFPRTIGTFVNYIDETLFLDSVTLPR